MQILVDTGPLVAVLRKDDPLHDDCLAVWQDLKAPPLTCWPVLTEAAWLLRDRPDLIARLLALFPEGFADLLPLDGDALRWITPFLQRYSHLKPDLADACLVYLAEREGIDTIFTLDRRDFSVYRMKGKRPFKIIP